MVARGAPGSTFGVLRPCTSSTSRRSAPPLLSRLLSRRPDIPSSDADILSSDTGVPGDSLTSQEGRAPVRQLPTPWGRGSLQTLRESDKGVPSVSSFRPGREGRRREPRAVR